MASSEEEISPANLSCRPMIIEKGCPLIKYPLSHAIPALSVPARTSSSGSIKNLPAELKQDVLMNLDLSTIKSLRLTNYDLLTLVDSTPAYRRLTEHAPTILRALQDTGTMEHHSLSQVYEALTSNQCTGCHDFGPFLFLLTCERKCFNCLYRDRDLRLMRVCDVDIYFAIHPRSVSKLLSLRSQPNVCWRPWYQSHMRSWKLVLLNQAEEIAIGIHGSVEQMDAKAAADVEKRAIEYHRVMQAREIWGSSRRRYPPAPHSPQPRSRLFGRALNEEVDWRWRYDSLDYYCGFGAIELPWLNIESQEAEMGVWCDGCRRIFHWGLGPANPAPNLDNQRMLERNHFKAWTKRDLLDHVGVCQEHVQMWREHVETYRNTHSITTGEDGDVVFPPNFDPIRAGLYVVPPPPPPPALCPPHVGYPPSRYFPRPQGPPPLPPPPPLGAHPLPPPRPWPPFNSSQVYSSPRFHIAIDAKAVLKL